MLYRTLHPHRSSIIVAFNSSGAFTIRDVYKRQEYTHPYPAVSVIVYAQNDAENLVKYLPKILNQAYPEFEVIVVNDRCV